MYHKITTKNTAFPTIQNTPEPTRIFACEGIIEPRRDTLIPKQEPPPIPRQETNPTDKYIQLLRDGLIDKADFLKLISGNKMETDGYIY